MLVLLDTFLGLLVCLKRLRVADIKRRKRKAERRTENPCEREIGMERRVG